MLHEVVSAVDGEIETAAGWPAEFEERLDLLALESGDVGRGGGRGGGRNLIGDGVQQGVPEPQGGAAEAVAGEDVVGGQFAGDGVVGQVPLDAQIVDGLETDARGNGRKVARRSEERGRHQVQRGIEDVAPAGNEGSAEVGIDEVLLGDLPSGPLARGAGTDAGVCGLLGGIRIAGFLLACAARLRVRWPQIEPLRQREAGLIDIAGDVRGIEQKHVAGLRPDAADEAVVQLRLDDVAELAMPEGQSEIALERGRTKIEGSFEILAIDGFVADCGRGRGIGKRRRLADGVGGGAQRDFREKAPARGDDGHGKMRIEVEPDDVAGVEEWLGAVQIADRGCESPIERGAGERAVEDVVTQEGQAQDLDLIAFACAGKGLEAVEGGRGKNAVAVVREHNVAGNLRAGGLRIVVVEDQAVDVAGKIFGGAGDPRIGREILAPGQAQIDATLVDELAGNLALRVGYTLLDAAVEERIPARDQVIEAGPFVAEVATRGPAAARVVFRADDGIHAAIDDPIDLFAEGEAADGRAVADHRSEQSADAPGLVGGVVQIGEVEDWNAKKLEIGVGG